LRTAGALAQSTNVQYLTVDQLLKSCKLYAVPVFQRRYCWNEQQASRLWQSINLMKDAGMETNNHSIGRLMLLELTDRRLVLDGQQRLTTLMLVLCSLRDRADDLDEKGLSSELEQLCRGRLIPTLDDRVDFDQCFSDKIPKGEQPLFVAKRVFSQLAEQLDVDGIKGMSLAIRKRLSTLAFVLEDERSVQRVYENLAKRAISLEEARRMGVDLSTCTECFLEEKQTPSTHYGPDGQRLCRKHAEAVGLANCETMTPGVEMSPVDLIRNFIMEHYPDEAAMRKAHAEYWSPLEVKAKGTEGMETVMREFLASQGFKIKHRWELYKAFIVWWRSVEEKESNVSTQATVRLKEILASRGLTVESET